MSTYPYPFKLPVLLILGEFDVVIPLKEIGFRIGNLVCLKRKRVPKIGKVTNWEKNISKLLLLL